MLLTPRLSNQRSMISSPSLPFAYGKKILKIHTYIYRLCAPPHLPIHLFFRLLRTIGSSFAFHQWRREEGTLNSINGAPLISHHPPPLFVVQCNVLLACEEHHRERRASGAYCFANTFPLRVGVCAGVPARSVRVCHPAVCQSQRVQTDSKSRRLSMSSVRACVRACVRVRTTCQSSCQVNP